MSEPQIFIAVPVYRGSEVVAETLRSIRDQTFVDFQAVISVDAEDHESAAVCKPFLDDPRFEMIVQPQRLGWPGNLNWLYQQCQCPFVCYWQQDDLASTNYLQTLHQAMQLDQHASIAFTDVQWFGSRIERDKMGDIGGTALQRALEFIEAIYYLPLRGVMRSAHLPPGEAIPVTEDESCQEEFVFLTHMAARGNFRHVKESLYFKRSHTENTFKRWFAWSPERRRRGWMDMGLGFWRVTEGLIDSPTDRIGLLATILDRLTIERPGRGFLYLAPQQFEDIQQFIHDFLDRGKIDVVRQSSHRLDGRPFDRIVDLMVWKSLGVTADDIRGISQRRVGNWPKRLAQRIGFAKGN